MNSKDAERFIKLLNLTASDNDHEAIAALRAANNIRLKSGVSWESLFTRKVVVEQIRYKDVQRPAPSSDDDFEDDDDFDVPPDCDFAGAARAADEYLTALGYVMPFGMHKGKRLSDVPIDYIKWASEKLDAGEAKRKCKMVYDWYMKDNFAYGKNR